MSSSRFLAAVAVALAVTAAGCSGVVDPSKNTVDTFTATLPVGGQTSHPFSAGKNGEFSVRLTSVTPNNATILGVYLGQPVSGVCAQLSSVTSAGVGRDALNGPLNKGSYCVGVIDPGSSVAQTYTLQVSHP